MIVLPLFLIMVGPGPEINAAQFAKIVKERTEIFKSVAFVYEGKMQWFGPDGSGGKNRRFNVDFEGAYLYRENGVDSAGVLDIFEKPNEAARVVHKKYSVINRKHEEIRAIFDPKILPANSKVGTGPGTFVSLNDSNGPYEHFLDWYWPIIGDLSDRGYTFQGWEEVNGRNCFRFQIDARSNGVRHDLDFKRFWIDAERNANVVKSEFYTNGERTTRNEITLSQVMAKDGKSVWFPTKGETTWFGTSQGPNAEVTSRRTIEILPGSVRINANLPDELFTVRRALALPTSGELADLERIYSTGSLRREFENQPPGSR